MKYYLKNEIKNTEDIIIISPYNENTSDWPIFIEHTWSFIKSYINSTSLISPDDIDAITFHL